MLGARVFRVFVSSTFTDMIAERNALQMKVFEVLRAYCAEKGYRFQAMDLRWGISDEASAGQRTMRICLSEIARCQAVSPRPNFVVLLGDRYGWRPLPEVVNATEFDTVVSFLPEAGLALAEACYERDDNAIPPVYVLRSRNRSVVNCSDAHERLRQLLTQAAAAAGISAAELAKYSISATEQEIIRGALKPPDAEQHVFCFLRSITDLPQDSGSFRDLTLEGKPDLEATDMLANLKDRLRARLGDHVFEYKSNWAGAAPGTEHIDRICTDMLAALRTVIDSEIERLGIQPHLDVEREAHCSFEAGYAAGFVGRTEDLNLIDSYLTNGSRHPLCIFSEGGIGKSALMAAAARKAREVRPTAVLLSRYIGITSASADLTSLLQDLCAEIGREYHYSNPVPTTLQELQQELPVRLRLATADRQLVLLLDGLDQLESFGTRNTVWLPSDLPENVRLVVSTRPGEYLIDLRRRLPEDNVIALGPMSAEDGSALLDKWLAEAGRMLRPSQRAEVLGRFRCCGSPLFLRLAFQEARSWTHAQVDVHIGEDVPSLIGTLYDRLAAEHGRELVKHALGFLAVTYERLGISEEEMLEALTADDHTWDEFVKGAKWEMPVRQLPVVVWSRLYFDLAPYLSPRASEGAPLITFFHKELAEVAQQCYPGTAAQHLHSVLADVAGSLAHGRGCDEREWRGTAHALAELPYHLTKAERWEDLYAVLTNFRYLEEKAKRAAVMTGKDAEGNPTTVYKGVLSLIDDLERALARLSRE